MATESKHMRTTKRAWLQFSLRTLMFVAIVSLVSSYLIIQIYEAHMLSAAKAELVHLGATISTDERGRHHVVFDNRRIAKTFDEKAFVPLKEISNLESVEFTFGFPISDSVVSQLEGLTSLKRLSFSGCELDTGVTDAAFARLTSLTSLQSLILDRMKITDEGLRHLRRLTSLRELSLVQTGITDEGLFHLQYLRELQTLDLRGTQVSGKGLMHVAKLSRLEELGVGLSSGDGLRHLKKLKRLKVLNMSGEATDVALVHIVELPWLNELYLADTLVTDASMRYVGRLVGLQKLDLSRTRVTDDGLQDLCDLENLEFLSLFKSPGDNEVSITDNGCCHLAELTNLRELFLTYSDVSDVGTRQLADHCTLLEVLCLYDSDVGNEGMKYLAGLSRLRELDVGSSLVGEDGVKFLQKLKTLEVLCITEGTYRDDKFVNLINSEAKQALERALPNCDIDWAGSNCSHSKYGDW